MADTYRCTNCGRTEPKSQVGDDPSIARCRVCDQVGTYKKV